MNLIGKGLPSGRSQINHTTGMLAAEVLRLASSPLDPGVLHQAERCILDILGCAIAGRYHPAAHAVRTVAKLHFAGDTLKAWFLGQTFGPVGVAYANSIAATILDLDDGNRQAMGHPGGAIIPAVLALAQELESDRDTVLRAIIAGYEVAICIGTAERRPSYHSGNYTSFGVAAAVAVMKGMDAGEISHALAICAYHGSRVSDLTLSSEMGSNVKESMAWSVVAGMTAADLAGAGFTGSLDALDIEERIDGIFLRAALQDEPAIMRTYFKKYSCCRWIHSATEALLELVATNHLEPSKIDAIRVETFHQAKSLNNEADPQTLESAQYSVPFCMALAVLRGEGHLMPLNENALGDTEVVDLAGRITIVESEDMNVMFPAKVPAIVTVESEVQVFELRVDAPWGEASRPPTDSELLEKFKMIASGRLPDTVWHDIEDHVFGRHADFSSLFACLDSSAKT